MLSSTQAASFALLILYILARRFTPWLYRKAFAVSIYFSSGGFHRAAPLKVSRRKAERVNLPKHLRVNRVCHR